MPNTSSATENRKPRHTIDRETLYRQKLLPPFAMELNDFIRAKDDRDGMKRRQREWADIFGVTEAELSRWLWGKITSGAKEKLVVPSPTTCRKIAHTFASMGFPTDEDYWLRLAGHANFTDFIDRVKEARRREQWSDGGQILALLSLHHSQAWDHSQSFLKEFVEDMLMREWRNPDIHEASRHVAFAMLTWRNDYEREIPFEQRDTSKLRDIATA